MMQPSIFNYAPQYYGQNLPPIPGMGLNPYIP